MNVKWIIAIIFMLILTVMDIRKKEISVLLLLIFGATVVFYVAVKGEREALSVIYSLIPGAFLLALSLCTRESIGYGDGWTMLVLGLLLGLWECLAVVFVGLVFSAIFSLVLLVLRRVNGKTRLPFLPFVSMGLGVVIIVQGIC